MVIKVYRFFYRLEDNGKTNALLFRDGIIVSLYHVQAIEQKKDPSVSSTALLGCNGYGVYNFFDLSRTVDSVLLPNFARFEQRRQGIINHTLKLMIVHYCTHFRSGKVNFYCLNQILFGIFASLTKNDSCYEILNILFCINLITGLYFTHSFFSPSR